MNVINKVLIAFTIAVLTSTTARADWYNVQFSNNPEGDLAQQYSGPGADPTSGSIWNLITSTSGGPITLKDSGGLLSATPISFSSDANIKLLPAENGFSAGSYANLFSGYMFTTSTKSFTFSGLDNSKAYSLYIYTQAEVENETLSLQQIGGGGGANISYSPGASTLATDPKTSILTLNQNYIIITNVHPVAGTVTFNYSPGNATGGYQGNINGIQLSSSAPEPSTLVLMGIGSLLFVAFRLKSVGIISAFSVGVLKS